MRILTDGEIQGRKEYFFDETILGSIPDEGGLMSELIGEPERDPAAEDMGRTFRAVSISQLIREGKIIKVRDAVNVAYPCDCVIKV